MRTLTAAERIQFDRMVRGEPYFADVLAGVRLEAQDACWRYGQIPPSDTVSRRALLEGLFAAFGPGCVVEGPFRCDYGRNIRMGEGCFLNYGCVILDCAPVTFGDRVLCGPGCHFYAAGHPLDPEARRRGEEFAAPITVGSDVWFGGHVSVLPGVTVGDGCVVGSGAVVTHDLPPGSIAYGNPARVRGRVPGMA